MYHGSLERTCSSIPRCVVRRDAWNMVKEAFNKAFLTLGVNQGWWSDLIPWCLRFFWNDVPEIWSLHKFWCEISLAPLSCKESSSGACRAVGLHVSILLEALGKTPVWVGILGLQSSERPIVSWSNLQDSRYINWIWHAGVPFKIGTLNLIIDAFNGAFKGTRHEISRFTCSTLPKFNIALKNDGWKTTFLLGWYIVRPVLNFQELLVSQHWDLGFSKPFRTSRTSCPIFSKDSPLHPNPQSLLNPIITTQL